MNTYRIFVNYPSGQTRPEQHEYDGSAAELASHLCACVDDGSAIQFRNQGVHSVLSQVEGMSFTVMTEKEFAKRTAEMKERQEKEATMKNLLIPKPGVVRS